VAGSPGPCVFVFHAHFRRARGGIPADRPVLMLVTYFLPGASRDRRACTAAMGALRRGALCFYKYATFPDWFARGALGRCRPGWSCFPRKHAGDEWPGAPAPSR